MSELFQRERTCVRCHKSALPWAEAPTKQSTTGRICVPIRMPLTGESKGKKSGPKDLQNQVDAGRVQ